MSGEGSGSAQGKKLLSEEDIALRRRPWTRDEDSKLLQMLDLHGSNWPLISSEIPGRSVSSCHKRWCILLTPNSEGERRRQRYTAEEDDIILRAQLKHGNRWETIAQLLPGRTSNAIQSRWRSNLCWRKLHAEGSQQQQRELPSSNSEIDFFERKRLCQSEEEDVETPDTVTMNLLEPDPITSLSLSLPGSSGDGGWSLRGKEKKNEDC